MTDIKLERDFNVTPARLFAAVTQTDDMVAWWGPEGFSVREGQMNFTKPGPWFAVLMSPDGTRYKMSGQVTHVDPPQSVGYTWGWHDDDDVRGAESFVTLRVEAHAHGSRLIVEHRELLDDEIGANHEQGWSSSLASLARFLETNPI